MMKELELPLHPHLETIFGYAGHAPRVVFYWEPKSDSLIYQDGLTSGPANSWAYLIWAAHPSVKPILAPGEHPILLLDRPGRKLYSLSRTEALEVSGLPHPSLHRGQFAEHLKDCQSPDASTRKEAQQLLAEFVNWLAALQEARDQPMNHYPNRNTPHPQRSETEMIPALQTRTPYGGIVKFQPSAKQIKVCGGQSFDWLPTTS
jgi:hypothetical protein